MSHPPFSDQDTTPDDDHDVPGGDDDDDDAQALLNGMTPLASDVQDALLQGDASDASGDTVTHAAAAHAAHAAQMDATVRARGARAWKATHARVVRALYAADHAGLLTVSAHRAPPAAAAAPLAAAPLAAAPLAAAPTDEPRFLYVCHPGPALHARARREQRDLQSVFWLEVALLVYQNESVN